MSPWNIDYSIPSSLTSIILCSQDAIGTVVIGGKDSYLAEIPATLDLYLEIQGNDPPTPVQLKLYISILYILVYFMPLC